jgi:hypothetical protein
MVDIKVYTIQNWLVNMNISSPDLPIKPSPHPSVTPLTISQCSTPGQAPVTNRELEILELSAQRVQNIHQKVNAVNPSL